MLQSHRGRRLLPAGRQINLFTSSASQHTNPAMAVIAEDLLIQPFRDVVALAETASSNAVASAANGPGGEHSAKAEHMLQASKALGREGERALRKVQSVWESQVANHGDAFRERILKQGSIENRRLRLEDLLWDFDDAIQLEEFDPDRYTALQAATKALALDIIETTKRLRIDGQDVKPPAWPLRVFPPLPPLPTMPVRRVTVSHSRKVSELTLNPPAANDLPGASFPEELSTLKTRNTGEMNAAIHDGILGKQRSLTFPSIDFTGGPSLSRETTISFSDADPPLSPKTATTSSISTRSGSHRSRRSLWFKSSEETLNSSESSVLDTSSCDTASTIQGQPLLSPKTGPTASPHQEQNSSQLLSILPQPQASRPPSIAPDQTSRVTARHPNSRITERSTYKRLGGLCPGAIKFRTDGSWASILEVSEFSSLGAGLGGEMLRASDGIIPLQFEETIKVGRCSACYYSHPMDEVQLDKSMDIRGIIPSTTLGTNYRLRLLYKSHLRVSSSSLSPLYACLWCISSNPMTTPREGDATVFPSASHLLRHLTTHPQPLPAIESVSVLHGRGAHRDSSSLPGMVFDLHLPNPATPIPVPDNVARLPRAFALLNQTGNLSSGSRGGKIPAPPGYTGEMLEFMTGAVITGVMFPEKWAGKWCLGRHDGRFGAFAVKGVEICLPVDGERPAIAAKGEGEEEMSVVSRWKWPPPTEKEGMRERGKDKDGGWLSFGKGEAITDVRWVHADSWCWSGTNRQGKTGVFPKSHVDLQTLAAQSKTGGKEKRKGMGFFSRRP